MGIEELLDSLAILLLPFAVGTAPFVVESNVHRYAPRVIAEVVVAKTSGYGRLLLLWPSWETRHLHLAAVILAVVGIQSCLFIDSLMQELATFLSTFVPIVAAPVVCPLCPNLIEGGNVVAGVGESLSESVGSEGDELCLGIDEIHRSASGSTPMAGRLFRLILAWLYAA